VDSLNTSYIMEHLQGSVPSISGPETILFASVGFHPPYILFQVATSPSPFAGWRVVKLSPQMYKKQCNIHTQTRKVVNSPFRHFAMSPCRHFAMSPFRHVAISPPRRRHLRVGRHLATSFAVV
jgi:hypothetical protein